MLTSLKKESYFLTWSFEGFSVPVYGDTSLVLLQGQLDSVPVAVKELNPRCPDLDGAGAEIKVNVQVAVEELDREVILQVNDQQKKIQLLEDAKPVPYFIKYFGYILYFLFLGYL